MAWAVCGRGPSPGRCPGLPLFRPFRAEEGLATPSLFRTRSSRAVAGPTEQGVGTALSAPASVPMLMAGIVDHPGERGPAMKKGVLAALLCLFPTLAPAQAPLVLKPNMDVLGCAMPDARFRLAGSNAPGQLFFPDEAVHLKFVFKKDALKARDGLVLDIQEITTRDPDRKIEASFTDTAG